MLTRRKTPAGKATTDLVKSAHVGGNAELFASILRLHVRPGSRIADVTFGLGSFWREVDLAASGYELHASDIEAGANGANGIAVESYTAPVDCRALPYPDASIDMVVLDPPYIEGFYRANQGHRAGSGTHASFRGAYGTAAAHVLGVTQDRSFDRGARRNRRRESPPIWRGRHRP